MQQNHTVSILFKIFILHQLTQYLTVTCCDHALSWSQILQLLMQLRNKALEKWTIGDWLLNLFSIYQKIIAGNVKNASTKCSYVTYLIIEIHNNITSFGWFFYKIVFKHLSRSHVDGCPDYFYCAKYDYAQWNGSNFTVCSNLLAVGHVHLVPRF